MTGVELTSRVLLVRHRASVLPIELVREAHYEEEEEEEEEEEGCGPYMIEACCSSNSEKLVCRIV